MDNECKDIWLLMNGLDCMKLTKAKRLQDNETIKVGAVTMTKNIASLMNTIHKIEYLMSYEQWPELFSHL